MCLAFKKSQLAVRKIAKNDITIYKMVKKVDGDMYTLFQNSCVELGKVYSSDLEGLNKTGWFLCCIDTRIMGEDRSDCMFISRGLHAFTNACFNKKELFESYVRELFTYDTIVLKGRIPKGSEYYENKLIGLIVSSSMVYDEHIAYNY